MDYLIIISYISLISWIYLTFFHGRKKLFNDPFFWSNKIIFEKNHFPRSKYLYNLGICVIIPARNEEKTILKTLNSIRNQKIKNLEIVVIDDNSSDKTSDIVKTFKKKFKNIHLIFGKKLPLGWVGKTWAMKQAVDYANKKNYKYYAFIDSDIVIKKDLLKKVSLFINSNDYVMISLMAKLNSKSIWEKILIPPFIYFFQKLYPFNLVINNQSSVSAAAGGFIFCKAEYFREENFYNQIKNKIIDDCNIAKFLKNKGSIWIGLTNQVVSCREYRYLKQIWGMVSRTAFEQLGHSIILLLFCLFGLFIIYLFPFITFLHFFKIIGSEKYSVNLLLPNFLSVIMMIIVFSPTIKFYKIKKIFIFTLPLSAVIYGFMTLTSALNHFIFLGNKWKGRNY